MSDLRERVEALAKEAERLIGEYWSTRIRSLLSPREEEPGLREALVATQDALVSYIHSDPSDRIGVSESDESEQYKQARKADDLAITALGADTVIAYLPDRPAPAASSEGLRKALEASRKDWKLLEKHLSGITKCGCDPSVNFFCDEHITLRMASDNIRAINAALRQGAKEET